MSGFANESPDAGLPADTGGFPSAYPAWLAEIKGRIEAARRHAAQAVNRELVQLYWQIGRDILDRQQAQGWGTKVIDRLARDLKEVFPDMQGCSRGNLMSTHAFADAWSESEIVQQLAGTLSRRARAGPDGDRPSSPDSSLIGD